MLDWVVLMHPVNGRRMRCAEKNAYLKVDASFLRIFLALLKPVANPQAHHGFGAVKKVDIRICFVVCPDSTH